MAALKGMSRLLNNIGSQCPLLRNPNPASLPSRLVSSRGVASKLFVGGLSSYTTDEALSEAFARFGQVVEAKIIMDRASDRSKGFGFVTFAAEDEAQRAIAEMNGKILNGRVIFVDNAKLKLRFDDASLPIARGPPEPPSDNK